MDGIKVKSSVRFDPRTLGRSEFWVISEAVQATAPTNYYATITSGCDGKHKTDSRHYLGWAKDYRIFDVPGVMLQKVNKVWTCVEGLDTLTTWVARAQKRLGNLYFLDLEVPKKHIHAQYNGGQEWVRRIG